MATGIEVGDLSADYSGNVLFKDLSIELNPGEHIVIVGGSGSGKSTLLRCLAEHPNVNQQAAVVLQEGALLERKTVLENLNLVARYNKVQGDAAAILEDLNIPSSLHQTNVSQLSGGQKRRIAIARCLLQQPNILLFDEPDAGLDVRNLDSLAQLVNDQSADRASVTVSHNPIYIAQIANRVLYLDAGELTELASWKSHPSSPDEFKTRQAEVQQLLLTAPSLNRAARAQTSHKGLNFGESALSNWLRGVLASLVSLPHWPKSGRDELQTASYVFYLACLTGLMFFALVGLMLGATTIAVVKLLADNALTGFVGLFLKADDLLNMMGGVYALYLAPPIGAMLFAARSGSIVTNWLGEMVRSKQVLALELLKVPTQQYLRAPSVIAVFIGLVASVLMFTAAVWFGGVIATDFLFSVTDPVRTMVITSADVRASDFWLKLPIYAVIVATTIVGLGLSEKKTSHEVNIHTTKAIIYSTVIIAVIELLIILSK